MANVIVDMQAEIYRLQEALSSETTAREKAEQLAQILGDQVRNLSLLLDQQFGTPCEQIRHRQELDAAVAAEREACAKIVDPPLMHRKGRIGLWRKRRAEMAWTIRARALGEPADE